MSTPRIIKKYPNRRLYDTQISSYITIEDVRQLVTDGEEFEVRDAKTGEDLTRSVLLQIISENEQASGQPLLSTQMLSQIIRFYGDSMQGFMGDYLERSMALFMEQQANLRKQFGSGLGNSPWTIMNQLTERNLQLWQELQNNMMASLGNSLQKEQQTKQPRNPTPRRR